LIKIQEAYRRRGIGSGGAISTDSKRIDKSRLSQSPRAMRGSWGMTLASPLISHCHKRRGTVIPQCEECRKVWLSVDRERWQAHWIDDGPEEKLVFYCPEYAGREFGGGDD
jgi:hypothetical protein